MSDPVLSSTLPKPHHDWETLVGWQLSQGDPPRFGAIGRDLEWRVQQGLIRLAGPHCLRAIVDVRSNGMLQPSISDSCDHYDRVSTAPPEWTNEPAAVNGEWYEREFVDPCGAVGARSAWTRRFCVRHRVVQLCVHWSVPDAGTALLHRLQHAGDRFRASLLLLVAAEGAFIETLESALPVGSSAGMLDRVCAQLRDVFDARGCCLYLDGSGTGQLALAASTDAMHEPSLLLTQSGREALFVSASPDRSLVSIPLTAGHIEGLLRLSLPGATGEFPVQSHRLLREIVDRLAVRLALALPASAVLPTVTCESRPLTSVNAGEHGRLRSYMRTLSHLAGDWTLPYEFDGFLSTVLTEAVRATDARRASLLLHDGVANSWQVVAHVGFVAPPTADDAHCSIAQCLENRRPTVFPDVLEARPVGGVMTQQYWTQIAIPLRVNDTTFGALLMDCSRTTPPPDHLAFDFLEVLGRQAALVVAHVTAERRRRTMSEPFEYVGRMLGGFLHVIGNKLKNIEAHCAVLSLPDAAERERRSALADLRNNMGRMLGILNDFRVAFNPRSGSESQLIDVNTVVTGVIAEVDRPHTVALSTRLAQPAPQLPCNKLEFEMAMQRLVENAVEAIGQCGGHIVVRTRLTRENLIVTISDTGSGMDRATQRACTTPFFTTKGNSHSGLGLTIVAAIMSRHHGRLRIASSKGKGTVCSLVLQSPLHQYP